MKRALGLIDSKMAQAKNWLRDPNAQPGSKHPCHLLSLCVLPPVTSSDDQVVSILWCY